MRFTIISRTSPPLLLEDTIKLMFVRKKTVTLGIHMSSTLCDRFCSYYSIARCYCSFESNISESRTQLCKFATLHLSSLKTRMFLVLGRSLLFRKQKCCVQAVTIKLTKGHIQAHSFCLFSQNAYHSIHFLQIEHSIFQKKIVCLSYILYGGWARARFIVIFSFYPGPGLSLAIKSAKSLSYMKHTRSIHWTFCCIVVLSLLWAKDATHFVSLTVLSHFMS